MHGRKRSSHGGGVSVRDHVGVPGENRPVILQKLTSGDNRGCKVYVWRGERTRSITIPRGTLGNTDEGGVLKEFVQ